MKNGLQNGLKCILRDMDFLKREGVDPPLILSPARGLRRSVQTFGFQCPP